MMPETVQVKRAHEWEPIKRGEYVAQVCRICGATRRRTGGQSVCSVEEVTVNADDQTAP